MPQDLAALLREYGGLLARIAASCEADPSLREDLMQDIAFALWRALPKWRGEAAMKTFVASVALNRGASYVVTQARHPATTALREDLPSAGATPERCAQQVQQLELLQSAVRSLPLTLRQTVTLALEGFSHEEIGSALGISANNVAVRLNRARRALRAALGECT